ncbi:hypothetical protein JTE90_014522 [Oedothorax gibbosus]|uniref:C-type lectin domain-containing protein n=1 Tax=Oedothorax gibbosus TaxID=931172 RepID=A0AAV6TPL7_9ARAC|nr:hypothetical protein JTE90_014522 [Oedothorax gibbosus]
MGASCLWLRKNLGGNGISSDHVLELNSVSHTGQVEPGSCFQKITGSVPTEVVLKDVSMEVHAGEVMAVLGSKACEERSLYPLRYVSYYGRCLAIPNKEKYNDAVNMCKYQMKGHVATYKTEDESNAIAETVLNSQQTLDGGIFAGLRKSDDGEWEFADGRVLAALLEKLLF